MSSVLVVIIIPDKDYEDEIREKEKLSNRLRKGLKKDILKTIDESEENTNKLPIEKAVEDGLSYLGIVDAMWQKSKNNLYHHIIFPVDLEDSDVVIQHFKSLGIGLRLDTSIGIIPFSLFCYNDELDNVIDDPILIEDGEKKDLTKSMGNFKAQQNKFLKSVTARLTVAQIVDNVRSNGSLTFDFVCYVIFASWIAAMGLLENSVISLVASMLVSPMMGPLMALTFGTIIKDRQLRNMGLKNISICFALAAMFGFLFGMIALNFTKQWGIAVWPTDFMRERGMLRLAWVGTLVAFPSGCAVAISLLAGNEASLVGVAISVSLLPPAVNSGLLYAYSLLRYLYSIGQYEIETISRFSNSTIFMKPARIPQSEFQVQFSDDMSVEAFILGCVSIMFCLVNITNIFIGAMILLKIKEIAPLSTLSPESRRFFQEDIRIAREYNQNSKTRGSNLGQEVLKEWADIAGLDTAEFLSNKPEARAAQLQTLADIAKDVQADIVYKTVTKNIQNNENMERRLSQIFMPGSNLSINQLNEQRRSSHISAGSFNPPNIIISDIESGQYQRRPSYNNARRRISTVALNNYYDKDEQGQGGRKTSSAGISNPGFNFNETDINNHNQQQDYDYSRRYSSALLRRTLQTSEHSPYSLWPSTRNSVVTSIDRKFTVTPVGDTKRLSIPQLTKFD